MELNINEKIIVKICACNQPHNCKHPNIWLVSEWWNVWYWSTDVKLLIGILLISDATRYIAFFNLVCKRKLVFFTHMSYLKQTNSSAAYYQNLLPRDPKWLQNHYFVQNIPHCWQTTKISHFALKTVTIIYTINRQWCLRERPI